VRCPRATARHRRTRAARASDCRHYRPACEVLAGLGQARPRCNAVERRTAPPPEGGFKERALRPGPRNPGPKLSLGMNSPMRESRSGTPTGVLPLPHPRFPGLGQRTERCRDTDLRLSAFCHLHFIWAPRPTVMDPILHCRIDLTKAGTAARIFGTACTNTRTRTKNAPRERDCFILRRDSTLALPYLFSRAQRSTERSGVVRCRTGIVAHSKPSEGPGTAVHHFVLHRLREKSSG
jgi:hypothetical protein